MTMTAEAAGLAVPPEQITPDSTLAEFDGIIAANFQPQQLVEPVPERRTVSQIKESLIKAKKLLAVSGLVVGLALTGCSSNGTKEMPTTPTPSAGASAAGSEAYYFWVGEDKYIEGTSASIDLTQENPKLAPDALHSLAELAVSTTNFMQRVEVGWTVDPELDGTSKPSLFASNTINGVTDYAQEGGGFVQVSKKIRPGSPVKPGMTGNYAIKFVSEDGGRWLFIYDGQEVGYYPASAWHGGFRQFKDVSPYGEVESDQASTCTQMGNGRFGSSPGSAQIENLRVDDDLVFGLSQYASHGEVSDNTDVIPDILSKPLNGPKPPYNYGDATAVSFPYGGPGTC